MSRGTYPESCGAPHYDAGFANLSLSGLDGFHPLVDPDLLDSSPEWFHSPDHGHPHHDAAQANGHGQPVARGLPLSPHDNSVPTSSYGFPSMLEAQDSMHRPSYPSLASPMEAGPLPPRPDSLMSPTASQNAYPPFNIPYPESTASSGQTPPEEADQAADEEKRKRNQAASARFRQKKKQREQQMIEQGREMTERTKRLEGEVDTLSRENKFLKRLLVEKVENMSGEEKDLLRKAAGLAGGK